MNTEQGNNGKSGKQQRRFHHTRLQRQLELFRQEKTGKENVEAGESRKVRLLLVQRASLPHRTQHGRHDAFEQKTASRKQSVFVKHLISFIKRFVYANIIFLLKFIKICFILLFTIQYRQYSFLF